MTWQDFVIAAGQLFFAVALIPALRGPQKPPVSMCLMTCVSLIGFSVAYASLGMWGAHASVLVCAAGWAWLIVQQEVRRIAVSPLSGKSTEQIALISYVAALRAQQERSPGLSVSPFSAKALAMIEAALRK